MDKAAKNEESEGVRETSKWEENEKILEDILKR